MNIQDIRSCMHSFEEAIFLGEEMEIAGILALVAGICREGKKIQIYLFSEAEDARESQKSRIKVEKKRQRGTLTKREEMLAQLNEEKASLMDGIRGITVNGTTYEFCCGSGGRLEDYNLEGRLLVYQFLSSQVPFGFLEDQDFSRMQYAVMELEGDYGKIPFSRKELENLAFVQAPRYCHVPVKQKIKLPLGAQPGKVRKFFCEELNREIHYSVNAISLVDTLEESKKKYREMDSGHIIPKEEEELLLNYLQEICPPGMRNLQIEYECEEAGLEFYTREQLQEKVKIHEGAAATFFLVGEAMKKEGVHGKTLHACLIQYPVDPDIQEVELELLRAVVKK